MIAISTIVSWSRFLKIIPLGTSLECFPFLHNDDDDDDDDNDNENDKPTADSHKAATFLCRSRRKRSSNESPL